MSKADLNLLVARHNLTKLNEIKQSAAISEQTAHLSQVLFIMLMKNLQVIMDTMVIMVTMTISTMLKNIFIHHMITTRIRMNKKIIYLMILLLISGCSLSPGMYMSTKNTSGSEYVFIDSLQRNVMVNEIDENILESIDRAEGEKYRIGNADQIAVTVWGIPEVFPITNINAGSNPEELIPMEIFTFHM